MPLNRKLLDILVCPITKLPVFMLDDKSLEKLNGLIAKGKIKTLDGEPVKEPLTEGLITGSRKTIYRIDRNIPIMLEDQAISADQIKDGAV